MSTSALPHPLTPLPGNYQPAALEPLEPLEPAEPARLRDHADEEPAERTLPGRRVLVTLEGGEELEVRIDNRDYLRWDKTAPRQRWGSGRDVPFLFLTFLTWSAAKRAGATSLPWESYSELVVECEDVTDEDADAVRPTR